MSPLDPQDYTVGWISAVTSEFVAAQCFFDEEHDQLDLSSRDANDNNNYALGKIGKHNVVMAVLPKCEYGTTTAATVARDMVRTFPNVRIGLMVGIAGGAPSKKHDIRLGDVVVSARSGGRGGVLQYDYGKAVQDHRFEYTGHLDQPPQSLLTAVSGLEARYKRKGHQLVDHVDKALSEWPRLKREFAKPPPETDRLYKSSFPHVDTDKDCDEVCGTGASTVVRRDARGELDDDPAIHLGLIASANRLMKDALVRDKLADEENILCFETEAAGLMNHFPCLVIRGICDYADTHKNKKWQGFAAMMAAAYTKDLLCQIPSANITAESPIREILGNIQSTSYSISQGIDSMKDDHQSASIRQWLDAPDPSPNIDAARQLRHAGTGSWVLNMDEFREWEAGSRQHLWLLGPAGCGKSVLSATIIDHLRKHTTRHVTAFFFDFSDTRKQKLESLQRSIAMQLFHLGAEAAEKLTNLFESCDNGSRQVEKRELSNLVELMMRSTDTTILLDAIDECTTRRELLLWLQSLASKDRQMPQLIITGRPEAEFLQNIPALFGQQNCIELDNEAVDADIGSYVRHEIQTRLDFRNKRLPSDLVEQICKKLGDEADGMFRWAACQLDSLAACDSIGKIKSCLRSLPRDLDETYRRMIQKIPSDLKQDALRLLQFLTHALQPITIQAAVEVIATKTQDDRGFDSEEILFNDTDVLRYCPGLMVTMPAVVNWVQADVIRLAHFSVKEFLITQDQLDPRSSHVAITKTYLTYVKDTDRTDPGYRGELDFYMIFSWGQHAALAEAFEDMVSAIISVFRSDSTFRRMMDTANGLLDGSPDFCSSRLGLACAHGLTEVAKVLIKTGSEVNEKIGAFGATPLYIASCNFRKETVQLLLDHGVDVNAQGGFEGNALQSVLCYHRGGTDASQIDDIVQRLVQHGADVNVHGRTSTPLQAASTRPDLIKTVRLLLDRGANPNTHCGSDGTALAAACGSGNHEATELLLRRGADVNAQGSFWDNPLMGACSLAYDLGSRCVRLLLGHGANVNAQDGRFGSPLHAACWHENSETIQLLVDAGVDINAKGINGSTVLQTACYEQDIWMIQLLLDAGADINAKGGQWGTALQAACYKRDSETIQLLLDAGADINAKGGPEGTALQTACYEQDSETIQLLLDEGADINAKGGPAGTALQATCYEQDSEIIQLLLDAGADINAEGGPDGTALQVAGLRNTEDVVQLLRDRGARE